MERGIQISDLSLNPENPAGMMPTTVSGTSLMRTVRPTIDASAPYRRRHSRKQTRTLPGAPFDGKDATSQLTGNVQDMADTADRPFMQPARRSRYQENNTAARDGRTNANHVALVHRHRPGFERSRIGLRV